MFHVDDTTDTLEGHLRRVAMVIRQGQEELAPWDWSSDPGADALRNSIKKWMAAKQELSAQQSAQRIADIKALVAEVFEKRNADRRDTA